MGSEQKIAAGAVAPENEEATEAWSGVLFRPLRQVPRPGRRGSRAAWRRRDAHVSARTWRPRPRYRLRLRRHHTAARQARGRTGAGCRSRRRRALHPGLDRGGGGGGCGERRLLRHRRPGRGPERPIRLRVLTDGGDVLRQPRSGAAEHSRRAPSGRPAGGDRLAAQARQRVAPPGRAGGRAVPREAGGARGRALRPRAVLDGRRRHRLRAASDRRVRARRPSPAAIFRSRSATTSITRSPSTWR